ncbi:ABC transporter ATP-binding protein [Alicyclobacillus fastidiosus]|uniref:ABC transporter ATP-binding protein n=1 Tax=Alicyclobacillus fastidiosus TaxID=392011 RepID=A0ABY6ZM00_9BACL|nr:ABC transporter ATP-binding protein [Alicyclobacillus fastidiosus]WAH43876.1 ABC transporter ATP-binding protein [Alicyclobacillus fastidiosus]GMA60117.1 putative ABC transporter ATP-binding protein YhcH [Alicyclobacillus fastidiosus]
MANAVELRNVTKTIGNKQIVKNLTLDIPEGEVFGLLGPNGAGKTTTIRMMVGLISISTGQVLIKGHDVAKDYKRAIHEVGSIVENPEMYKYLTGYQNLVQYARMVSGVDRRRIDEVVEFVGLEKRIHEKVRRYSLGMRQRLGLAQALLHKPSVLVLDEPTNGLDPAGIRELRDHLRYLAKEAGVCVVVSSHLLSEMELMCDKVAIIQNGELVRVQDVEQWTATDDADQDVVLDVGDVATAQAVLKEMSGVEQVTLRGSKLQFRTRRALVPELNRRLVKRDVPVYEMRVVTKSLEDRFLEITGG